MRHQRPSSAKRGADSFHACGNSTAGLSYLGSVAHPNKSKKLIAAMRRMVRRGDALVRHVARLLRLVLDIGGPALLSRAPGGGQIEEHLHAENLAGERVARASHL